MVVWSVSQSIGWLVGWLVGWLAYNGILVPVRTGFGLRRRSGKM